MLQALLHYLGPKVYHLFNKTGPFSSLGVLFSQYSEALLEIEKKKSHLLCQHCYRELNMLSTPSESVMF